ncbi:MAG: hypothetical protein NT091_00100 [Candidatus Falkowbacteria bacterium]|nr:hypothetical protein [Candidatus Falkowbacteria bacterium]
MIQIHLAHKRQFSNLNDLSAEYYKQVLPLIEEKTNATREIYNFVISGRTPNLTGINKYMILNILSLLCERKVTRKAKFNDETEKIDFLKKYKSKAQEKYKQKVIKKEFVNLLSFLNGSKTIVGRTLKQLIVSEPITLEKIDEDLQNEFSKLLKKKTIIKFLFYILDYSQIHKNIGISRLIFDNLDLKACPYCNRNYISYIEHAGEKQIGPTLDHFFSKSDHPFLSASFFNLIPSCYVCNSNIKGKKETTLIDNINPFFDGFGDIATFELINTPRNYGVKLKVDYGRNASLAERIRSSTNPEKGNAVLFKTENIYSNGHHHDIKMILKKCDRVDSYYKCSLSKLTKIHGSVQEFYRIYFSSELDEKKFNTYPLSKLKRDLVKERLPWLLI